MSLVRPEAQPPQQPSSPSADGEGGGGGDSNGALISRKRARSEGNDGAAVEASLQSQEHLDLDSLKTYGEAPERNGSVSEDFPFPIFNPCSLLRPISQSFCDVACDVTK